jgi:hypothetical protein
MIFNHIPIFLTHQKQRMRTHGGTEAHGRVGHTYHPDKWLWQSQLALQHLSNFHLDTQTTSASNENVSLLVEWKLNAGDSIQMWICAKWFPLLATCGLNSEELDYIHLVCQMYKQTDFETDSAPAHNTTVKATPRLTCSESWKALIGDWGVSRCRNDA